jgi:hypothetical protein
MKKLEHDFTSQNDIESVSRRQPFLKRIFPWAVDLMAVIGICFSPHS